MFPGCSPDVEEYHLDEDVNATVELPGQGRPREVQVKLRLPKNVAQKTVRANGRPVEVSGARKDSVVIASGNQAHFEIVGEFV